MLAFPADGLLFREQGRAEVYLIRGGERLHIPNPHMMEAMGLDWSAVQLVPTGSLDNIPLDSSWEPLGNRTPGSAVHVPVNVGLFGAGGKTYWPIRLAGTKQFNAWGYEVRTIELRGWIEPPDSGVFTANAPDPDFSYDLVIDADWVLAQGMDLSDLVRVGNILQLGRQERGMTDPRAWCSTPLIKMEIVGFPPKGQRDRAYPPDWTFTDPLVLLDAPDAGAANHQPVKWPFDPAAPLLGNQVIQGGEYVSVYGAIVTDSRHDDEKYLDAINLWATELENHEDDQPRWTEVHPPDWIKILEPPSLDRPSIRGVTVVAPGTWPGKPAITTVLDTEILAPPKPAAHPDWVLRCREFVGPETVYETIIEGNASKNGAAITTLADPDRIHLHVEVAGTTSLVGGSTGKFRALYLIDWIAQQPVSPLVTVPNVVGATRKDAFDRIRAVGLVPGSHKGGNRVSDQTPGEGNVVARGTRVTVTLEVAN